MYKPNLLDFFYNDFVTKSCTKKVQPLWWIFAVEKKKFQELGQSWRYLWIHVLKDWRLYVGVNTNASREFYTFPSVFQNSKLNIRKSQLFFRNINWISKNLEYILENKSIYKFEGKRGRHKYRKYLMLVSESHVLGTKIYDIY